MRLVWSESALADLQRFAEFLQERHPALARRIALEIARRARIIADCPEVGRPVGADGVYRELTIPILNAVYVFRYAVGQDDIRILRVFHSREQRKVQFSHG